MPRTRSKTTDGTNIASATPVWAGWLFFLIGICFLVPVYVRGFHPQLMAEGWQLFERPDDLDLWAGTVIAVVAFSGAGAAMLAQSSRLRSRQWSSRQKTAFPNEPWKWRPDWAARKIQAEQPAGRTIFIIWAGLCVLSGLPGTEFWIQRGTGWPDHLVSWMGPGAIAAGVLTLIFVLRAVLKTIAAPPAWLHMKADTGVLGGPLEAAIEYSTTAGDEDFLIRLVCEKHWISQRKNSEGGTTRSHETSIDYEDTYRTSSQNGLIPIRFGIPFDKPETTTDWLTPVYLWLVELEDLSGNRLKRFWVPVFKTETSTPDFELGTAVADHLIAEETLQECLQRYGIAVIGDEDQLTQRQTTVIVPAGQAASLAIGLCLFGIPCLVFAGFTIANVFTDNGAFAGGIALAIAVVFGGIFGLLGLLLTMLALQLLLEGRHIEIDPHTIRVRRSWFGPGWTTTISRDAVKCLRTTKSGSVSGRRGEFRNVVAETDGLVRRDGSRMPRRRSIANSLPTEAADALKTVIESITVNPSR